MLLPIIISSLLYSLSFIFIDKLWFFSFIFLTPIAYLINSNKFKNFLTFGFIWGFISFSVQQYGLYLSLINIVENVYIVLGFAFFAVIYQTFYSILWFYSLQKISYIKSVFLKSLIFSLSTFLYFYFLENYILLPFSDRAEGLIILSPLIPASISKIFALIIRKSNPDIALFLLILNSALISLIFIFKNNFIKLIIILVNLIFFFGFIIKNNNFYLNLIKKDICVIKKAFYNKESNKISAKNIAKQIKNIKSEKKIFIFPESSFYLCDLKKEKDLIKYFDKDINIIIGALRNKKDKYYNTLYYIYNGKIVDKFYKRHALLLTEKLPNFYFDFLNNIFLKSCFKSRPIISVSFKERKSFKTDKLELIPYICSEIFFNKYPDDNFKENSIIISCCNDSWISKKAVYLKKLMVAVNRFKAIAWKRYIIYIDYSSAFIFDKFSNWLEL